MVKPTPEGSDTLKRGTGLLVDPPDILLVGVYHSLCNYSSPLSSSTLCHGGQRWSLRPSAVGFILNRRSVSFRGMLIRSPAINGHFLRSDGGGRLRFLSHRRLR